MLRFPLSAALLLALSSCASVPENYLGPDAGLVVIGIGADHETAYSGYLFEYRQTAPPVPEKDRVDRGAFFWAQQAKFHGDNLDYDTEQGGGIVVSKFMRPGKYEIYNFDVSMSGLRSDSFSSKIEFSIPFEVRPGQTTYLGNYEAHRLMGKNFVGLPVWAGATFAVSDRSAAELEIARAKVGAIGSPIIDATPDVKGIDSPFFVSPGR